MSETPLRDRDISLGDCPLLTLTPEAYVGAAWPWDARDEIDAQRKRNYRLRRLARALLDKLDQFEEARDEAIQVARECGMRRSVPNYDAEASELREALREDDAGRSTALEG